MIIEFLFLVFGVVIGYNMRNASAQQKENRLLEEVDEQVRNDLAIAKNLNQSLMQDVRFLRDKIARMKND
jgi:hypothetical protein